MSNPLFNVMNGGGNMRDQFIQKLQQLKATGGDPEQRIQQMLNSGKISQADYNRAVQKAQELRKMFGI